MQSFHFSFEYSAWWLLPIVLVSAALAWWMYAGRNVWSSGWRKLLGSLRFLVLFLVLLLLLNPRCTVTTSYKEKPLFPLLIDNSQSMQWGVKNGTELNTTIGVIQEKLQAKGFEAPILTLDRELEQSDSIVYNYPSTDLAKLLNRGEKKLTKAKTAHTLLITDGISNMGISPQYQTYKSHVFTLGIGDTTILKDLAIKSVQNNSLAFLGNKFLLRAEIRSIGFANKEIEIVLKGGKGNVIEKQQRRVEGNDWHQEVDFTVLAQNKGYQRYSVEIQALDGESNLLNNKLSAYIDIVDDRENILLISMGPHPNIKAIRSAISHLDNIHLEVYMPGFQEPKQGIYDLVILNNCLLSTIGDAKKYIKDNTSLLYIAGSQVNHSLLQAETGIVDVVVKGQTDQVQASLNGNFAKFKLNESTDKLFSKLPPVEVVFGDINARQGTEVLLYQQINGVISEKPMMLLGEGKRKTGLLLSDGLWLMRMYEANETETTVLIDELITKTVQYLSNKDDKRKFRIYPHQKEYYEGEAPLVEVELYNDLYEKVLGQKVQFQLQSSRGQRTAYDFVPGEGATALLINPPPSGVYKVAAKTEYGGNTYTAQSEFIVKERQLEALDLQANHALLRDISKKSEGVFYPWKRREELLRKLEELETVGLWKSKAETKELIEEKWYYFLIILLIASEWAIRRYTGGY